MKLNLSLFFAPGFVECRGIRTPVDRANRSTQNPPETAQIQILTPQSKSSPNTHPAIHCPVLTANHCQGLDCSSDNASDFRANGFAEAPMPKFSRMRVFQHACLPQSPLLHSGPSLEQSPSPAKLLQNHKCESDIHGHSVYPGSSKSRNKGKQRFGIQPNSHSPASDPMQAYVICLPKVSLSTISSFSQAQTHFYPISSRQRSARGRTTFNPRDDRSSTRVKPTVFLANLHHVLESTGPQPL